MSAASAPQAFRQSLPKFPFPVILSAISKKLSSDSRRKRVQHKHKIKHDKTIMQANLPHQNHEATHTLYSHTGDAHPINTQKTHKAIFSFSPCYMMPLSRRAHCHFHAEASTSSNGVSAFQPNTLLALSTLPHTCSMSPARRPTIL